MKNYFYKIIEKKGSEYIVSKERFFVSKRIIDSFDFDRVGHFELEVKDVIVILSHYLTENDHSYKTKKYQLKELEQIKTLLSNLYRWDLNDNIGVW